MSGVWEGIKWTFGKAVQYATFRVVSNPMESLAIVAILSNPTTRGVLFRSGGAIIKYEILDWGGRARLYGGILARESKVIDKALFGGRVASGVRLGVVVGSRASLVGIGLAGAYILSEGPQETYDFMADPDNILLTRQLINRTQA